MKSLKVSILRELNSKKGEWTYLTELSESLDIYMGDENSMSELIENLDKLVKDKKIEKGEFVSMGPGYSEWEGHTSGESCYRVKR